MSKIIYNIGFLFDDNNVNQTLKKLSQDYNTLLDSSFVLGINSLPHVTILQVLDRTPDEIKAVIENIPTKNIPIIMKGMNYIKKDKYVHYDIRVQLTQELIDIQNHLITELGQPKICNKLGVLFYPHITLGKALYRKDIPMPLYEDIFKYPELTGRLTIGQSSPDFRFEKEIT